MIITLNVKCLMQLAYFHSYHNLYTACQSWEQASDAYKLTESCGIKQEDERSTDVEAIG